MSDRRHLLLAWGLMCSIVLTFAAGLWLPAVEALSRNNERIGDAQSRVEKVRSIATTQRELKKRIAALSKNAGVEDSHRFFAARSTALGVADLQRRVLSVITKNRGNQVSSQPLAGSATGDFHKLEVTVSLSADLPTIQGILYDLEYGEPQIFVEQLLVSAQSVASHTRTARQTRAGSTMAKRDAGPLSARMLLSGYMPAGRTSDARTSR